MPAPPPHLHPPAPRAPWLPEALTLLLLFALHLASFGPASPLHGPGEVFDQDSGFILESLVVGERYPWNPQNHVLYHLVVERGYDAWKVFFGSSVDSAFAYLKLFTALAGLAFLVAMRQVLLELGLGPARRIALLVLAGVSVSVWFHSAAFETHVLALPALALWLLCLIRLRDSVHRPLRDRLLFVGSLLVMGWTRVDLFRFALLSAPLPFLPGARHWWRGLVVDLGFVAVVGVAGLVLMTGAYLGLPPRAAATATFGRHERPELEQRLGRIENLHPRHLAAVGRAVSVYSLIMPVAPPDGVSSFSLPTNRVESAADSSGAWAPTGLFRQHHRNLLGSPLSALAFIGVLAALIWAIAASLRRVLYGDPLHASIALQATGGWLLYTWFNPLEPFLWGVEFVPLWIVLIGEAGLDQPRRMWVGLVAVVALVGAHNLFAFYLPFK